MQFGIINSKGKNVKIQDTIGKLIAINSENQTLVDLEPCSSSNETLCFKNFDKVVLSKTKGIDLRFYDCSTIKACSKSDKKDSCQQVVKYNLTNETFKDKKFKCQDLDSYFENYSFEIKNKQ